ncbi:hypothetical protein R84B8_00368 [Treponema sp. R8-4-B8]
MKKFVCVLAVFTAFLADIATQDVAVFPQLGHSDGVNSVAISPDGKTVVSGSDDGTIKLWDLVTSREIRTLSGHSSAVESVMFSPDSKTVVSGSSDNTIKLWDAVTGREIRTLSGHSRFVEFVVFSPDGKNVVSGSWDETIKLWDVDTGREIRTLSGHSGLVLSVAFSSDGKTVVSSSSDNTIKLWDSITGREIRTLSGHTNTVTSVAFSPDVKTVVSGSYDKSIKLWDTVTGREIRTLSGHSGLVLSVAFSPDGKTVVSGSEDKTIKLWDAVTGSEIRTLSGHSGLVFSVAFSPDGKTVVSGSSDDTIKLWDAVTGREIRTLSGHSHIVESVAFSPDGKTVVSGSRDKTIKLWDVGTGREIHTLSDHSNEAWSVAFSPDSKTIVSGSSDNTIKLWDAVTGNKIHTLSGHSNEVWSVAFSPDSKTIVSGSGDNTIKLWDVITGREIRNLSGHSNIVTSVAFSPDGKTVVSGSDDKTIKLWDVDTGSVIRTMSGHSSSGYSITFSPDGKTVVSGSGNTIKLWDVVTGREIRTLSGHSNFVPSVVISPDGKIVFSGSIDTTSRLWDVATGKEIAQFIGFIDNEWIVITPDGYYNASPKGDQYLNVRIENEVYGMDQFAKIFYRPDVVENRLQGLPDPSDIKPGVSIQTASIPPALKVSHGEVDPVTRKVTLTITAADLARQISDIEIIVNGRPIGAEELKTVSAKNLKPTYTRLVPSLNEKQYAFNITLQLDPGLNRIEIVAANDANYGLAPIIISVPQSASKKGADKKGDLWVLAIGVNKYMPNPDYHNLEYAVSDSKRIVDSFRAQQGRRFNKVHTLRIADNEKIKPTKKNILANMDFLKKAGPNDVALLFVAAHGKTEDGVYYFLTADTVFTGDAKFDVNTAVSIGDMIQALDIPCRKIVLLDTCESGGVDNNRLIHNLRNRSTVILTASQEDQSAREKEKVGGYFTYEITRGLQGGLEGEAAENGVVPLNKLGEYVIERVGRMSFRRQKPVKLIPDGFNDFIISVLK